MNKPQLNSKIMNGSPTAMHPTQVPDSKQEDNSFADRSKFPKDKDILSKDTMGNKALIEDCSKSSSQNPGIDKGFLGKANNDMTKDLHSL
jgi:hypothetical protein